MPPWSPALDHTYNDTLTGLLRGARSAASTLAICSNTCSSFIPAAPDPIAGKAIVSRPKRIEQLHASLRRFFDDLFSGDFTRTGANCDDVKNVLSGERASAGHENVTDPGGNPL